MPNVISTSYYKDIRDIMSISMVESAIPALICDGMAQSESVRRLMTKNCTVHPRVRRNEWNKCIAMKCDFSLRLPASFAYVHSIASFPSIIRFDPLTCIISSQDSCSSSTPSIASPLAPRARIANPQSPLHPEFIFSITILGERPGNKERKTALVSPQKSYRVDHRTHNFPIIHTWSPSWFLSQSHRSCYKPSQ